MNTIIVIPTLDESDNIPKLFNALKVLKKINYKICFVDGSKDNRTINEIKKYFKNNSKILKEKKNISKISSRCAASRMGFEWAVKQKFCELIVDMDCDLANDPNDIIYAIKLFKKKNYDLIITSKYLPKSSVNGRTIFRSFLSKFYTVVCQIFINKNISDYSNSYRFYKKKYLKKMLKKPLVFKSPIQHLENLKFFILNNYKIGQIHTNYNQLRGGKSVIKLKHLIIYFYEFVICLTKKK
tara:strand:+ start:198 stop:917 length:720 start_codon:yes stop_codon:yes gene_type:complete